MAHTQAAALSGHGRPVMGADARAQMKEQLAQRLEALRAELKTGQKMEAELEGRLGRLRATLLRISGAIQVLEELLDEGAPRSDMPPAPAEPAAGASGAAVPND
jgi:hypothetical protein